MALPFVFRRPWLLLAGALADRDRPPLARLRGIADPEEFVWSVLPHAARTFGACILLLPAEKARAAAVAYLYARILDTYEDLCPDLDGRERALKTLAARLGAEPPAPPPPLESPRRQDGRDDGHLLLVEKLGLVDRLYLALGGEERAAIRDLVGAMAEGMCWSSRRFAEQGGVLADETQLLRYCRNVLGQPVAFTIRLLRGDGMTADLREDAMRVGEMVQLANIMRDIEKDLRRGVAYDPRLRGTPDAATVRAVRGRLLDLALSRAPSYRRMLDGMRLGRFSLARASALLMLHFTSRHFRRCARRLGRPAWHSPGSIAGLLLRALPAACSPRWAAREIALLESAFVRAC